MIYALFGAILSTVILAILGFQAKKKVEENRREIEQNLLTIKGLTTELNEAKMLVVKRESELEVTKRQVQEAQKQHLEQKETLTKQLELMGKDFISQGSKMLKSENEQQLAQLLSPFKEKLEKFEKDVKESHLHSEKNFSNLEGIIKLLTQKHDDMHSTAQNLVDALRGENKMQGNWGEMALERILEISGLQKGEEYFTQGGFRDEENRLFKPDVIIQMPDNKQLIIDSKVSLKAFETYINEEDESIKEGALKNHITSLKAHIKGLSDKNYTDLPDVHTVEFVLMFIPLESSVALAVKEEPGLYEFALERKIVLVTPSTLLATLKTVGSIWKYERQNRNALEIADQAGKLYDKFVGFLADMEKIKTKQLEAVKAQEDAMNKLVDGKGNLVVRAEKLRELGVKSKKNIDSKYLDQIGGDE
ncbi:MAG: DNA recombination protein RmuC [Crocinitomicaceae bacterium]|jgi:DNA recombination protein RmuC|nr:DNA recombination protein RmuC [Crocinitomicaceae bacterium]